jgi:hypothetical protein
LTPSRKKYTKTPPQTGVSVNFLIEKSPKTVFFDSPTEPKTTGPRKA